MCVCDIACPVYTPMKTRRIFLFLACAHAQIKTKKKKTHSRLAFNGPEMSDIYLYSFFYLPGSVVKLSSFKRHAYLFRFYFWKMPQKCGGWEDKKLKWGGIVLSTKLISIFSSFFFFFQMGRKSSAFLLFVCPFFFTLKGHLQPSLCFFWGGDIVHSAVHAQGVPNIYVLPVGYFEEGGGECCDAEGFSFSGFSC